ncbi:hypothetical protein EUZ85_15900 [Hahella sp. KA22]|nr:hypothetical protein ENC22_13335 [Hahella sp. KA22]QAY58404.1 hypothetical protein EUZ85_15900 [Hahella sp. KA22]
MRAPGVGKALAANHTTDSGYCPGFYNPNWYLLISIVKHWNWKQPEVVKGTDRDEFLMDKLEKMAEAFRKSK